MCLYMYHCVVARHTFPHHTEPCAICKDTLRDPVEINCPGFCTYCRECALSWFGGCATNRCPKCNVDVTAIKYKGGVVPLQVRKPTDQRPPPRKATKATTNSKSKTTATSATTTPSPT